MSRAKVQLKRYGLSFVLVLATMAIGTICGFYILLQQRLPNPFDSFYSVNAAFPTAAGVVPGLGEPVNVAGVHVGEITGTSLANGQAVIHMEISPSDIKHLYRGASAQLVPETPLKNMEVDIQPGNRALGVLPDGATIPVGYTTSPTDSDELLDQLDTDTRTWLTSLVTDVDQGTVGRGRDIRSLLGNLAPTAQQLRQIGSLLAGRRQVLAAIVHNLGVLTHAAATKNAQIGTVVRAGNTTLGALASQNVALAAAVRRLPNLLQTTNTTLGNVATLSNALGPTATALVPTAQRLPSTLRDTKTVLNGAALLPLKQIRPFVNAVQPLAGELPAATSALNAATPPLLDSFKVLAYTTNELAYSTAANPGFLYWMAWTFHNANSVVSTQDANGAVLRGTAVLSCGTLEATSAGALLKALLGSLGC